MISLCQAFLYVRTCSSSACWQHALSTGNMFPAARDGLACALASLPPWQMAITFFPNRGDALVTACEASSASVAMPTLLHEAMQTSMQSMFGAQKML